MQFLDPQKVLSHFSIEPGMRVAELHSGSGHFTPLLLEAVGEYGALHSFQYDESADVAEFPESADRVLAINIPLVSNHHSIFSKAYRMLKPQGRIILIEQKDGRISEEAAADLAGMAGFLREKRFAAGDLHFGLVFKRM